jgi:hypothetical protein
MTAVGLGGVMIMNVLVIVGIHHILFGPITFVPLGVLQVVGVSPVVITHIAFVRHNRYVDVVRRFRRRSASEQRRAKLFAWTYVALSVVAPFLVLLGFPKH